MRGIDHDDINPGLDQKFDPLIRIGADSDRRTDPQLAELILAGIGMLGGLQDVLDGDQAAQRKTGIDHQHTLKTVPMHQFFGFIERRAFTDGHEPLARRHDRGHRLIKAGLETKVAIGDDTDHLPTYDHRQAGDAVLARDVDDIAHRHVRRDRDRIAHDAGLESLDSSDFARLLRWREILVDDADAAFLGDGDGKPGLGDGVHGSGHQRDVQRDAPGQSGRQRGITGKDVGEGGNEQDVVEGQRFLGKSHWRLTAQK